MEEWNTEITYKINEITTQIDEIHNDILLKEIVEFCGQKDLLEYRISIDTLKEALNFYFKYKERPKGKWTPGKHECPCCGESKFKDLDADIWADWYPKYCPNCGAEMENNE